MHDYDVEVLMPSLSTLADNSGGEAGSPEDVALAAAESGAREVTDVYMGETAFLLVVVRGPDAPALRRAVSQLQAARVTACAPPDDGAGVSDADSPSRSQPAHRALPVLRESAWVSVPGAARPDASAAAAAAVASDPQQPAGQTPPRDVVCKGLWVLLRAPMYAAGDVASELEGRQRLNVVLRQQSYGEEAHHWSVEEAMAIADRHSLSPPVFSGSKIVCVHTPLQLTCRYIVAGGNAARAFLTVTATNTTTDAVLSVTPPHVHLAASLIVEKDGLDSLSARTSGKSHGSPREVYDKARGRSRFSIHLGSGDIPSFSVAPSASSQSEGEEEDEPAASSVKTISLEDLFVFKRELRSSSSVHGAPCAVSEGARIAPGEGRHAGDDGEAIDLVATGDERTGENCKDAAFEDEKQDESGMDDDDDDDLSSESWNGSSAYDVFGAYSRSRRETAPVTIGPREIFDFVFSITPKGNGRMVVPPPGGEDANPRLAANQCFETAVSVSWACRPRGSSLGGHDGGDWKRLRGAESVVGRTSLTGQRCNTAVQVLVLRWSPPSVVEDILMTFTGPAVAADRSRIVVTLTVANHTSTRLNSLAIIVNNGGTSEQDVAARDEGQSAAGVSAGRGVLDDAGGGVGAGGGGRAWVGGAGGVATGRDNAQLVVLRPVICVGGLDAGASATVRLVCVALGRGCAGLGDVRVADTAPAPGVIPRMWRARAAFQTFVAPAASPLLAARARTHTRATTPVAVAPAAPPAPHTPITSAAMPSPPPQRQKLTVVDL